MSISSGSGRNLPSRSVARRRRSPGADITNGSTRGHPSERKRTQHCSSRSWESLRPTSSVMGALESPGSFGKSRPFAGRGEWPRLMRANVLAARLKKAFRPRTTLAGQRVATNLIKEVEPSAPDQVTATFPQRQRLLVIMRPESHWNFGIMFCLRFGNRPLASLPDPIPFCSTRLLAALGR